MDTSAHWRTPEDTRRTVRCDECHGRAPSKLRGRHWCLTGVEQHRFDLRSGVSLNAAGRDQLRDPNEIASFGNHRLGSDSPVTCVPKEGVTWTDRYGHLVESEIAGEGALNAAPGVLSSVK